MNAQRFMLVPPLREDPLQMFPWAGSKERIAGPIGLRLLEVLFQNQSAVFWEPFLGSAAVYLRLRAHGWEGKAVLSDAAPHLISLYQAIQKGEPAVSSIARDLQVLDSSGQADLAARRKARLAREAKKKPEREEEKGKKAKKEPQDGDFFYKQIRACFNEQAGVAGPGTASPEAQAARFLYLVHRGFNGLWRQNKKGEMNTPFGGDDRRTPMPTLKELSTLARLLRNAELSVGDFEPRITAAGAGDVVYCDSPYWASNEMYVGGFKEEDHVRLRDALVAARARGVHVFASNLDLPEVRDLYNLGAGWTMTPITLIHSVGGVRQRQRKRQEVLIEGRP